MNTAKTRQQTGFVMHPLTPLTIQLRVMRGLFIPMRSRKEGIEKYKSKVKPYPQPTQPPQKSIRPIDGQAIAGPPWEHPIRVIRTPICLEWVAIEHTQHNRLNLWAN